MLAGNVGVWLCGAVLRVDAVSAEKITKPLDLLLRAHAASAEKITKPLDLLLRAHAASAEKITAPLDLLAQGRHGCPLRRRAFNGFVKKVLTVAG
jgi:hypothetical protein